MPKLKIEKLSPNAQIVLEERYLLKDENGKIVETPEILFDRVAKAISSVETKDRQKWNESFFEMMANLRFLPNSPTLMNAGRTKGQLSACFVLPIENSLEGVFRTLVDTMKIQKSGGGTGFSFSKLGTGQNDQLSLIPTLRLFNQVAEVVQQGGKRRGANMGTLRVDHPEVLDFITLKTDNEDFRNFNISVSVTDDFMARVRTGRKKDKDLFLEIAKAAWKSGDPGLIFVDRMNRFNPNPRMGSFETTNPCGEQPLLPYESCNLGSINLASYYLREKFDWKLFSKDVRLSIRFLDDVIEANEFPVDSCMSLAKTSRKIGLGVMGFADLLVMMGIPYSSVKAREVGEGLMSFLNREARRESALLAEEKGCFPAWNGSIWQKLGYSPLRNSTVSTVAPTGTISILAGASSGIEPIYASHYKRYVLSGKELDEIPPLVEQALDLDHATLVKMGHQKVDWLMKKKLGNVWQTSRDVSSKDHILVQAAFQRHSDSAVSKTVNLPKSAQVEDVYQSYLNAYLAGCKGITVYRDGSKAEQVLVDFSDCEDCE